MVCGRGTSGTPITTIAGTSCPGGAGYIYSIAGTGDPSYTGDGASASAATLSGPSGVALDGAGNLYIADSNNNVIRMISAATGFISTVVGSLPGTAGYLGDNGPATSAQLNSPQGVTVDSLENLYIADTNNQRIRRVDGVTHDITTAAGDGAPSPAGNGTGTYTGDGGPATAAGLSLPNAVAFDAAGNMYIADSANNVIRMVAAVSGAITSGSIISRVVGSSSGAAGNSGDGGLATNAQLSDPLSVAVDPAGNLYIADTGNKRIRKVNATTGEIAPLIGNGAGFNQPASNGVTSAQIYAPQGLFLDGSGNLYFTDFFNMLAEEVQSNLVYLDFTKQPVYVGVSTSAQTQTVENDGNAALDLTAFHPTDAVVTTASTCNVAPPSLAVDTSCVMDLEFEAALSTVFPANATQEQINGTVDILGNTDLFSSDLANTPLDIVLMGEAKPVDATSLTLTSNGTLVGTGVYSSIYPANVTFTATVTSGAGTPTGTVTFMDGATTLAPNVPLTSGVAIYTTTIPLSVGLHSISATYTPTVGSGFLAPDAPTDISQEIFEATATALAAIPTSPSVLGTSVTFTATVTTPSGGGVPPDGTVTFTDTTSATTLCPAVALALVGTAYQATCPAILLPQGANAILATYSGDLPKYINGSTSATLSLDVQATSTTTLTSNPYPSSTYGLPVTFTVMVPTVGNIPATGKVNIYMAGQAMPLNGTTPLTLTTVAGTAQVTFPYALLPVSTSAAPDVITASYLGDPNYSASTSNVVNQVVNQAQTSTAVSANPNPGIAGAPVVLTATITVTLGVSKPTGTVTFVDTFNGVATTLGSPALSGTGTATVSPMLAPGSHSIVATYSGDTDDGTSTGTLLLTVNQAVTTTVLTSSANPSVVLAPVTFTAVVASIGGGTPTGSVIFTDTFNGATTTLACAAQTAPIATCTISTLAVGTHQITAQYSGDTNDAASTSNTVTQVVGKIPTITGLGSSTTSGATPEVILVATVVNDPTAINDPTPTGTVTFTNGTTVVGSAPLDSTGVATLIPASLPVGSFTIVATYSGDAEHSPSTSASTTISNPGSGFNLTVTPPSVTVATTQSATVSVNLTSISGFTDTIGLGCASLPAGVNCHFSSPSVLLAANGTETVSLTIDTNNPLGGGASSMNARPGSRGVSLAGLFLPLSLLFGSLFWRFRRRYAKSMTAVLVLFLGVAALLVTGCSGFTQSSAAPGTYVIQVTGTGANSNISHYQNVTLTITAK
jgi:sugar lactone lactonase YvrE